MRLGVADARAGTPRARLRRATTARAPAGARRAARSVSRSARGTCDAGAVEEDASGSSSRRSPASPSDARLAVSDDASPFARLEAVAARVFGAVSPDADSLVPTRRPPRLSRLVRVVGPVPEIDWAEATRTEARFRDLVLAFAGSEAHAREPLILRGAADAWPCVRDPNVRWTLANLTRRHGAFAGETRVRRRGASDKMRLASSEFQYVEANHPAVKAGVFDGPSTVREMTLAEVAARMTTDGREATAATSDGDDDDDAFAGAYMQAELRGSLLAEAGMTPDRDNEESRDARESFWSLCDDAGWRETQPPRLWLSQAGSTSSLHYDSSVSVLAQAHGLKRMLLYPPSALARAALYPDWHPLRRRSALRLTASDGEETTAARVDGEETTAARARARWAGEALSGSASGSSDANPHPFATPPGAWEAVLGPGDVLVFPPRWAHYTESLGPRASASVTRRFAPPATEKKNGEENAAISKREWRALVGEDAFHDAAASASAARRFARWRVRAGGPSPGARALEQLERAGVVRAVSRNALRLDPGTGAVLSQDAAAAAGVAFPRTSAKRAVAECAKANRRSRRLDPWLEAAEDAARAATAACEGWPVPDPGSRVKKNADGGDPLDRVGLGRVAGVYARGSVARGEAIPGVSDVDLVVLCWDDGETRAKALRAATRDATARVFLSSARRSSEKSVFATKVDVRVALVPQPPHPAGCALAALLDGDPRSETDEKTRERVAPEAFEALAASLGADLAFALSAESVAIVGADVPSSLPERSRVPPPRCLPTLRRDVVEALADGGERSLKWALRRALRAAFEEEAFFFRRARKNSKGDEKEQRARASTYTRDLFRCALFVARRRPELGEDLACALVAAVHGPRAVWGALWYAGGSALAQRLTDAVVARDE